MAVRCFYRRGILNWGRGEPVSDSARVLSEMCDAIMVRTFAQETIEVFAEHASVPVINGLTDKYHPCQLLADLQTFLEHRGDISGRTVAWVGDGNNMCNTYIEAASLLEFNLRIAVPEGFEPALLEDYSGKASIELVRDPVTAVRDAALVVTDVWASMGQEDEAQIRRQTFRPFPGQRAVDGPRERRRAVHGTVCRHIAARK